jgi:hypothetical protein
MNKELEDKIIPIIERLSGLVSRCSILSEYLGYEREVREGKVKPLDIINQKFPIMFEEIEFIEQEVYKLK